MRRLIVLFILTVTVSACSLTAPPSTPVPTPDIPSVEFQFPQNQDQVIEGVDLTVDIIARDTTTGIQRIEFYVDNELIREGIAPEGAEEVFRVNMNWLVQGLGRHTLSAIAYRPDGTASDEAIIGINVITRDQLED